jgi:hypothetical protein
VGCFGEVVDKGAKEVVVAVRRFDGEVGRIGAEAIDPDGALIGLFRWVAVKEKRLSGKAR